MRCRCPDGLPNRLAACGETQPAQFSRWGLERRCIPAEPPPHRENWRCAPLCVAFRSKYTRYSSLTRLVSRAPTGRTGPRRSRRSPGFHHRLLAAGRQSEAESGCPTYLTPLPQGFEFHGPPAPFAELRASGLARPVEARLRTTPLPPGLLPLRGISRGPSAQPGLPGVHRSTPSPGGPHLPEMRPVLRSYGGARALRRMPGAPAAVPDGSGGGALRGRVSEGPARTQVPAPGGSGRSPGGACHLRLPPCPQGPGRRHRGDASRRGSPDSIAVLAEPTPRVQPVGAAGPAGSPGARDPGGSRCVAPASATSADRGQPERPSPQCSGSFPGSTAA